MTDLLQRLFIQDAIDAIGKEARLLDAIQKDLEKKGHNVNFEGFKSSVQDAISELQQILAQVKEIHKQAQ